MHHGYWIHMISNGLSQFKDNTFDRYDHFKIMSDHIGPQNASMYQPQACKMHT